MSANLLEPGLKIKLDFSRKPVASCGVRISTLIIDGPPNSYPREKEALKIYFTDCSQSRVNLIKSYRAK
jgi:hypothetical protein